MQHASAAQHNSDPQRVVTNSAFAGVEGTRACVSASASKLKRQQPWPCYAAAAAAAGPSREPGLRCERADRIPPQAALSTS